MTPTPAPPLASDEGMGHAHCWGCHVMLGYPGRGVGDGDQRAFLNCACGCDLGLWNARRVSWDGGGLIPKSSEFSSVDDPIRVMGGRRARSPRLIAPAFGASLCRDIKTRAAAFCGRVLARRRGWSSAAVMTGSFTSGTAEALR